MTQSALLLQMLEVLRVLLLRLLLAVAVGLQEFLRSALLLTEQELRVQAPPSLLSLRAASAQSLLCVDCCASALALPPPSSACSRPFSRARSNCMCAGNPNRDKTQGDATPAFVTISTTMKQEERWIHLHALECSDDHGACVCERAGPLHALPKSDRSGAIRAVASMRACPDVTLNSTLSRNSIV